MVLNSIRRSKGETIFQILNVLFMVLMIAVTLYPFLFVVFSSLSDSKRLIAQTGLLVAPVGFTVEAYQLVFKNPNIISGYMNTLFIVIVGTIMNLIMTSLGAYVLSRKGIVWTKHIMLMIVFTMFFSGGMIPTYLLVNNWLHLGNNLLALIIPGLISTWNLIILRTSFSTIPESLIESARMDGAQDFTILFRIVIPLSMPVMAVMLLFYGVAHWNSWFGAMLYLRDRELFPLQLILREILIQNNTSYMSGNAAIEDVEAVGESIKYATIIIATLPILFVYPFLQKYFVKGVMIGSVKE
ncbi:carbohydrate ABC transporter permease [Paenibacillus qinlingensis]|uniref:Aldouronate transport system permease protein n=1 Tax=Paenibacillus qinlingensis TaxID=1837343 RepID=A0ABU1NQ82_9BACL|nr:carbohydrate ABC transporter permease [Paenibacillus qinlingensis]MDR6549186.1 putative aldouronate transport system permease protein [Paenibacillus qinlingensis]